VSTTNKCAANDKKDGKWRLTGNVHACDDHKEKGLELLEDAVSRVKSQLQELAQPHVPPTPTPATQPTTSTTSGQDKWGINKIYPDATDERAQVWYMNQDDPTSDARFKNWKNADLRREPDGAWSADGSGNNKYQVRLEGWSESGSKKWLNCEITVYANVMTEGSGSGPYAFQIYRGGGHHSSKTPCDGCAYKARIRRDRRVTIVKEIIHPDYTSNRGNVASLTKSPIGNYIGVKQVVYNLPKGQNNRNPVKVEVYVDENGMDANGRFDPTKQTWKKMAETVDSGDWASGNGGDCDPIETGYTGRRKSDEILNTPGGTSAGNLAAYRTDGVGSKIKFFSIREIVPPVLVTPPSPLPDESDEADEIPPIIQPGPMPPAPEPVTKPVDQYIHEAVNRTRQQNERQSLSYDEDLESVALKHSKDMIARNYFSHTTPEGKGVGDRYREAAYTGCRTWGENIAWFSTSRLSQMTNEEIGMKIFDQWWNSPGHKTNILSSTYSIEGIGIYISGNKVMATQNFCRK
jgi:uncharacterized protein YkwD